MKLIPENLNHGSCPSHLTSTYSDHRIKNMRWCLLFYYLVPVCFSFPNPKSPFWNYKYNISVWLGIKSNFLEKVAFWVCEENAHSQNRALRCILEKLLRVDESIRWVIGSVTKLPSLLLKTLTLPYSLLPHILAPLLQTNIGQESINQIQTQHHPIITGLPPQPISTFDNPNTKSTKSNQK